ncbi:MAG: hypothetical protein ACRDS0_36615 [Pseudonocardiaceae bacterium]
MSPRSLTYRSRKRISVIESLGYVYVHTKHSHVVNRWVAGSVDGLADA